MTEAQKQSERFKRWYEKNKEQLAEKRKKRYRSDPGYRAGRKTASKKYYWLQKRRAVPLRVKDIDLSTIPPDEIADVIISNEDDIRCGMVAAVPMYYPGTLAKLIDRSVQTVRLWSLRGYIPDSTYRNRANYRLFTRDQLEVYVRNSKLLKIVAKDFSKHPFFTRIKWGLDELEPDGIRIMNKDEWRLVDERCNWCRKNPALQHYSKRLESWEPVPCFACMDPYKYRDRVVIDKRTVTGHCGFCNESVEEDMYITSKKIILQCPICERRIPDPEVIR